jgi:8-oxo-dGTP pyrophosphatase MutT (NUDIX family)
MQVLSFDKSVEYLAERGVARQQVGWNLVAPNQTRVDLVTAPSQGLASGHIVPAARWMVRHLTQAGPYKVLLLLDEQGVWPSAEDWLMPMLIRGRWGHMGADFLEFPGTLLQPFEAGELTSLLACAICFSLGFIAVDELGYVAVRINHDGKGWISSTDPQELAKSAEFWANLARKRERGQT